MTHNDPSCIEIYICIMNCSIACFWLVISDVFARVSNVSHSVDSNMMSLPSSSSYIITGSIPEQDGDRIYNTCTVYGPNGDLLTTYRKVYNIVVSGGAEPAPTHTSWAQASFN